MQEQTNIFLSMALHLSSKQIVCRTSVVFYEKTRSNLLCYLSTDHITCMYNEIPNVLFSLTQYLFFCDSLTDYVTNNVSLQKFHHPSQGMWQFDWSYNVISQDLIFTLISDSHKPSRKVIKFHVKESCMTG